jgi:hypothetical protein
MEIEHRENFGELLKEHNLNGVGIEIGVQRGDFARILLDTTELKEIILLDSWQHFENYQDLANHSQKMQDYLYNLVKKRFVGEPRIRIIKGDCRIAVIGFEDESFDFIYHDANHTYEFVSEQLKAWFPKLKKGGIMAGHDYFDGEFDMGLFGVKSAVDEFVAANNIELHATTERECKSWWFIK